MLGICTSFEPDLFQMDWLDIKDKPLWILGKSYSPAYDINSINQSVRSRIWFTYRKRFSCIEGTGPSSDQGWGCMLRCGQMLLAHALVRRHLGPDWIWSEDEENATYRRILRMFQDKKTCLYSIHQIAQMGVSEGKPIGEWFGPNTIAHVLKKLSIYDEWSSLAIHIAMDSVVIQQDIRQYCHIPLRHPLSSLGSSLDRGSTATSPQAGQLWPNSAGDVEPKPPNCLLTTQDSSDSTKHNYDFLLTGSSGDLVNSVNGHHQTNPHLRTSGSSSASSPSGFSISGTSCSPPAPSSASSDWVNATATGPFGVSSSQPPQTSTLTINHIDGAMMHCSESFDTIPSLLTSPVRLECPREPGFKVADGASFYADASKAPGSGTNLADRAASKLSINNSLSGDAAAVSHANEKGAWRPLLLIVPLRLGLTTLNPVYIPAIKEFFMLKQCLGIIGGRPNHALYFIGMVGEELIYLDPHDCQPFVDLDDPPFQDTSYHCDLMNRMFVRDIDPSLALAFYCHCESEFEDLCKAFDNSLLLASQPPLFELMEAHPAHIPPFVPYTGERVARADFMMVEPQYDSDEEFEILT